MNSNFVRSFVGLIGLCVTLSAVAAGIMADSVGDVGNGLWSSPPKNGDLAVPFNGATGVTLSDTDSDPASPGANNPAGSAGDVAPIFYLSSEPIQYPEGLPDDTQSQGGFLGAADPFEVDDTFPEPTPMITGLALALLAVVRGVHRWRRRCAS